MHAPITCPFQVAGTCGVPQPAKGELVVIVEKNKVVSFDYTPRDSDGNELDSSEGSEPLSYLHGAGNIIPGLEAALSEKSSRIPQRRRDNVKYPQHTRQSRYAFRPIFVSVEVEMPQGKIKKLVSDRGFGFLESDRGDLFFHHSEVQDGGFESLHEGQMVEYEIGEGRKGPCATSVRLVESD